MDKKNKPEILIHLAAVVETEKVNQNKIKAKNVNYVGTKNLLEALKKTT